MPTHFALWPFRSLVLRTQKLNSASVKNPELSKLMFSLLKPGVGQTITKRMLRPQPDSTKVLRMRLNKPRSIRMQKKDVQNLVYVRIGWIMATPKSEDALKVSVFSVEVGNYTEEEAEEECVVA